MSTNPVFLQTPTLPTEAAQSPVSPVQLPPHPFSVTPPARQLTQPIASAVSRQDSVDSAANASGRPPGFEAPRGAASELRRILHLVDTHTLELSEDEKQVLESIFLPNDQIVSLSYLLRLQPRFVYSCANLEVLQKLASQIVSVNAALFAELTNRTREQTKVERDTFQMEHILRRTIGSLQKQKEELEGQIRELKREAGLLRQQAVSQRAELLRRLEAVKSHLDEALPAETETEENRPQIPLRQPRAPQLYSDERAALKQERAGLDRMCGPVELCGAHGHRRRGSTSLGTSGCPKRDSTCLLRHWS
eukprot:Gregarina_sp_Poly_1__10827@NODE_836_length_6052_cov_95_155221_g604_i0_p4_GENE_NODE_836_length_6052_cov_95_155221_g604_i0NODE_836_length_6052_cov_95_155221_g604_i0_p4_ORF_typecomplete_len306_score58_55Cluap1/PF10234_9/0_00048Ribosomal_L29/PF00831_23/0_0039Myosin_tail_1/PF01576_19/0_0053LRS4/PF10422_9/3e03LRS4/PF10422_9/0_0087DUF3584/PF12128_8/0_017AIP3/PF03915_13/0_06Filament/PF00038_21/0_073AAA_23/PF13476_6/0_066Taxilin/PF09728_9/0_1DUF724/PF05266_14/2e03DUF724/PF05266_14/3_5Prefoldin/PF02996_17